jgi:hypothetical protein
MLKFRQVPGNALCLHTVKEHAFTRYHKHVTRSLHQGAFLLIIKLYNLQLL